MQSLDVYHVLISTLRLVSLTVLLAVLSAVYRSQTHRRTKTQDKDSDLQRETRAERMRTCILEPHPDNDICDRPESILPDGCVSEVMMHRSHSYNKQLLLRHRLVTTAERHGSLKFIRWTDVPEVVPQPVEDAASRPIVNNVSPTRQKEYLQSLLHFRAFRNNIFQDASWEQWNCEARNILGGATILGSSGIAVEVYDTLCKVGVLPDVDTFKLLIETSLTCGDMKAAKMFLKRMSSAGFVPEKALVDDVLRRLSNWKKDSTVLNADAPEFVPTVSIHSHRFL